MSSSFELSNNVSSINFISFSEFDKIAESSVLLNILKPRYLVTYLNSVAVARLNNIGDMPFPCLTPVVGDTVKY